MDWLYWVSLFFIVYVYFGYPIVLILYSLVSTKGIKEGIFLPKVTVIIPFYNAERQLKRKLENTLQLNYPVELLEIIAISDCSDDASDEIAKSFSDRGVQNYRLPERSGKHYAQGKAVQEASGEIIVFTDVGILLSPDTVELLVRNFADSEIGCVSSLDRIIESTKGTTNSEGAYIRYDMWLRKMESQVCSSTGMSGSLYAARKELCEDWIPYLSNDYYMAIKAIISGYRAVLDTDVIGYYQLVKSHKQEFPRKVRTIIHGLEVLFHFAGIMNPFRYGFYAIEILSHKLFRWLVPLFMIILFLSNLFLINDGLLYKILMMLQLLFYVTALSSHLIQKLQLFAPSRIVYFFCIANLSIVYAWYNYLLGRKFVIWEPSKR